MKNAYLMNQRDKMLRLGPTCAMHMVENASIRLKIGMLAEVLAAAPDLLALDWLLVIERNLHISRCHAYDVLTAQNHESMRELFTEAMLRGFPQRTLDLPVWEAELRQFHFFLERLEMMVHLTGPLSAPLREALQGFARFFPATLVIRNQMESLGVHITKPMA